MASFTDLVMAQTILTASNLPVAGDQFFNKTISDTSISPGSGGANVTWNYSSFFISPLTLNEVYTLPSATPFASSFPQANLAVNSYFSPSGFDYYRNNGTELLYYGFKDNSDELLISNTQQVLTVPFTYGNSVSNVPVTGTGLFGANLSGTVSVNADAWGTLILNDGSYSNTTRVVYDYDLQTDFGGPGTETFYRIKRYSWYHSSRRAPVFQISVREISGSTTAPRQKYVTRTTITTGQEEMESPITFQVQWNLLANTALISFHTKQKDRVVLEVIDMNGRVVKEEVVNLEAGNNKVELETASLQAGIYLVHARGQAGSWQERLIKP